MKVLVTGASSMIGRHVIERLAARGDAVTALQRRRCGLDDIPGVRELTGSIDDPTIVGAACTNQDVVVHLAARVGVVGSFDEFHRTNVTGTESLLTAARRRAVRGFVHVSSPSVAHTGSSLVGAGATPAAPDRVRGHYSVTKALAEQAALTASSADLAVVAIRPHLVWGPGDTQLVGRIVERARSGRLALVGSGTALVDTTWVDNAADALVAAADRILEADTPLAGRALVVSNGEPRTVHELVTRIASAAGVGHRRIPHVPTPLAVTVGAVAERLWSWTGRTDDPPMTTFLAEQLSTAHWFDQSDTRRLLGWRPAVGLDEGFERLAAWFRSGA